MSIYDDVLLAQQLIDECFDLETGEINEEQEQEAIKLRDEIIAQGLEVLCKVRVNYLADIEFLKAEEKRIKEKRQRLEKSLDRLEDYILLIHKQSGQDKSIAGTFTVNTRKSTSVIVDDDFNDERFQTIIEEKKIDKTAIKKALTNGEEVAGAYLQINENLQVR
jgi:Na+-translocating ferredoxin:NAD+ oxidoreductase RnfC subunit